MSIFELIRIHILSRFRCHRLYYRGENREPSTTEHVASGMAFALIVIICSVGWIYLLCAYPLVWGYYAPFKEYVLDRKKNKGRPDYEVRAQILERSAGFVVALPFIAVPLLLYFL